jgi:two-component system OmpR family sensor kinase/two-component system sensor histidine kinase BaeS
VKTLASRLLLAFAAVIFLTAAITVVLTALTASSQIRHVMTVGSGGSMEMLDTDTLRERLAAEYSSTGSWSSSEGLLDESGSHMRMMGGELLLASPDGEILAGSNRQALTPIEVEATLPITIDGETVGLLYVREVEHMMQPEMHEVVRRVNQAVWLAAVIATVAALGLSLVIVRTTSRPLERVVVAASALSRGDLEVRVPEAGPVEIRSVATAFNRMAESLNQQEQLRQSVLSDVAHELRTPLAVIQGQIEALSDGIFPPTAENLAPLEMQIQQLTRLVEDLRTLAHADAGRLDLERVPVDLHDVVSDLVIGMATMASARQVMLEQDVQPDLPRVDADPVRLRQVLGNVVANALRHTSAGGAVRVSAERAPADMDEGAGESSMVRIEVFDNGPGISEQDLPHVFERFYRADSSRTRATGGSGLGLAIARRLTEAHGGTIGIDSAVGAGTTVTLLWPVAPTGAAGR